MQHVLTILIPAVWPLLCVLFSDKLPSPTLHMLSCTYVLTVCVLACAPLLFLDCDIKCYGPNCGARGMLSLILSLSVPLDALQARVDGLGTFALCALLTSKMTSPLL